MRIHELLEARIAVPTSTKNAAMRFVLSNLFSNLASLYKMSGEDFLLKRVKALSNKYGEVYNGKIELSNLIKRKTSIHFSPKELPANYQNKKAEHSTSIILQLIDSPPDENYSPAGSYSPSEHPKLVIKMPSVFWLSSLDLQRVHQVIVILDGVIEHELMHASQHLVFGQLGPDKEVDYYNSDGSIDKEKYFQHKIEYHPHIITSVRWLQSHLRDLPHAGVFVSDKLHKEILKKWVDPDAAAPSDDRVEPKTDEFFRILKSKNYSLWRTAAKEFFVKYSKDLDKH